jgi:outer membrane protein assembly factor BamD (BamD/ComL family)
LAALVAAVCAGGCASLGGKAPPSHDFRTAGQKPGSETTGVRRASYDEGEEDAKKKGLELSDFSLTNLNKQAKKLTGTGPNRDAARKLYQEGDELYRRAAAATGAERTALFEQAAPKFYQAAQRWPDSALAMDGYFMAAESMFFADNYPQANDYYERLVKDFPNNRYLDTVAQRRFSIAKFWLEQDRKNPESFYSMNWFDKSRPWRDRRGHGLRIFDKIRIDDPTGRLADDATLAAANEHFAAGKFLKADEYYSDLRKAYPQSEHQFLAHFLGLKAKLASYTGPAYGGNVLDEAEKLIKQIRRQFPVEAEKEREFLDRAAAEVRYRKAERLEFLAKYYDYREEYRAAGHYYEQIARNFGDTPLAPRAETRIAQISGLPPKPPQQAAWLVNLIPSRDKVKPLLEATARERELERQQQQQEIENIAQQPQSIPAQPASVQR